MKPRQLAVFVAIIMAAVWLVPGRGAQSVLPPAPQESQAAYDPWSDEPPPSQPQVASFTDTQGADIVLQKQGNGHFYARPMIESRETNALVDTGASMIALTARDARAIGLDWSESDLQPVARGASGEVLGVPVVLDRVTLGGFEAHGVEAAIIPHGLDVTLLGQSFLSRIERVEITGDTMVLSGG
jgi:aspartyl protease family protein